MTLHAMVDYRRQLMARLRELRKELTNYDIPIDWARREAVADECLRLDREITSLDGTILGLLA